MDKYIEKIIKDNDILLKDMEIKKINIGFTNLVYNVGNKYIIKICNDKKNEERFKNEINFYLKNINNKYIPKLYKYYISTNEKDYSYEIIEKINGKSLYFVWHLFDEQKRKDNIREISLMMKSLHQISGPKYDWGLFIKKKLLYYLEKCSTDKIFTTNEKNNIEYIINNIEKYLYSDNFKLVHADIHFDNIIIDDENKLKIIDFETSIYAPIDYELDIFLRMCNNPLKYSSEETEEFIKIEDYKNIPSYLKEYYPQIFNFKYYDIRHKIYDLEANFRLYAKFKTRELRKCVLNIVDELLSLIK